MPVGNCGPHRGQERDGRRLTWPGGRTLPGPARTGPAASLSIQLPLQLLFCTLAVVVLLIVSRWEQLPLTSIGVRRPDVMTAAVAMTILLLAYYVLPLLTTPLLRVLGLGGFERGLEAIANQPRWWRVCLALTSGPVEELLDRGWQNPGVGLVEDGALRRAPLGRTASRPFRPS